MSSIEMNVVGAYLRLTARPRMATAERARTRMNRPKTSPRPTAPTRRRHIVTEGEHDGFRVYTVTPRHLEPHCTVVYLHGGAYIAEIARQHWGFISRLADRGARVVVPIYGLAPQHSYRDAYPFVTEVYLRAAEEPGPLTLMGDSSGGGLALGLAQTLRDLGAAVRLPDRLVLISPWLDLTIGNPEVAAVDDPWLVREGLLEAGRAWAAGDDPTAPRLSPLNAELTGLPHIDIHAGTRDLAYPDCKLLRERTVAAGGSAALAVEHGGLHVTPLLPVPEGRASAATIAGQVCTLG